MKRFLTCAGIAWIAGLACAAAQGEPRERIEVVAGFSAFDYARALIGDFSRAPARLQPGLEGRPNEETLAAFCAGVGLDFPDAALSVEHLEGAVQRACRAAGVTPIELKLGLQGLAVVQGANAAPIELTRRELFLASARDVPASDGQLIPNPYRTWRDINPKLPARPVHLLVPAAQTIQRDNYLALVMLSGARFVPELAELAGRDPSAFTTLATSLREGGEVAPLAPGGDVKAALEGAPDAFAVVDLGATSSLKTVPVESKTGNTALTRPVYLYVKREHLGIVRALGDFLAEAAQERVVGDKGLLASLGLVPLSTRERDTERQHAVATRSGPVKLARNH